MKTVWPLMIAILILSLLSTSCIVRYSVFPQLNLDGMTVPKKDTVIFYYANPETDDPKAHELVDAFTDNRLFAKAIFTTAPPEKGIYCAVNVRHTSRSDDAMLSTIASYLSLGAFPSYSGTGGERVRFDLYLDNELKKIYRYQVTEERWMWLGLLPFVWVNFFTSGADETFRAIVHQFVLDAEKDGYL